MITYKDKAFCSVDCVNGACDRNKVHTQKAGELPIAFTDFSGTCGEVERPEHIGKTLNLFDCLTKAQEHMTGFNEQTRPFYSLGIEVAGRLHELRGTSITRAEYDRFVKLLQDLGLAESMVDWINKGKEKTHVS